jgi:A/G-specific adenine glycosylase
VKKENREAGEGRAAGRRLSHEEIAGFQGLILDHYRLHGRDLPWRKTDNPYHIFVSEVMLQQTQVERVTGKYGEFIRTFPDFRNLAAASLKEILGVWQGMGYNRRALALVEAAGIVAYRYGGFLPDSAEELAGLPGIGKATAASILAFAFNKPVIFIETNVRRVFIETWFSREEKVSDKDILPLVDQTLDRKDPRTWYHALMDYGSMLGKRRTNANSRSVHYRKQGPFKGSDRKIRGMILRLLIDSHVLSFGVIGERVGEDGERIRRILGSLEQEGLVREEDGQYSIP